LVVRIVNGLVCRGFPACLVPHLGDPPIAVASILGRQRQDGLGQPVLIGAGDDRIKLRAMRLANDPAGLAFRELMLLPDPLDRLPATFGAYKFPEEISFKTCFSSDRSAISHSSRTFLSPGPSSRVADPDQARHTSGAIGKTSARRCRLPGRQVK